MCKKEKIISSRLACYCLSQFRVSSSILLMYKRVYRLKIDQVRRFRIREVK